MRKSFATAALLLLAPCVSSCGKQRPMSVCNLYDHGKQLHGTTILLSGLYVTGPSANSGLTDTECPDVRIPIGYARELETEKITSQFIAATSYLDHNVAFRIQATGLILWSSRNGLGVEIDRVRSFQAAPGAW